MVEKEEQKYASSLFEGIVSFRAVVDAAGTHFNSRRIEKVFYSKEKLSKSAKEFSYIKAKAAEMGFEIEICPREKIDGMTVGTNHGGIAFTASERALPMLNSDEIEQGGFYVMLEGIEDPYNFGYALRSIYASGADGIILSMRNWMSAGATVCRSSAGASERIPIYLTDGEAELIELKKKGYKIVCADIKNSVSVYDAELSKPIILVVGGEKRGISSQILGIADEIVRLDYGRNFDAALSAASAASIISFEVYRRTRL